MIRTLNLGLLIMRFLRNNADEIYMLHSMCVYSGRLPVARVL